MQGAGKVLWSAAETSKKWTIIVLWKWAILGKVQCRLRYEVQILKRVPRGVNQGRSRGVDAQNREVNTQKSCINVDHIAQDRWRPPLVDADWHASCQAIYKGLEGKDWEELYYQYKGMSTADGLKKPNENQKATAKDKGDDFYDPEPTGTVGRAPQRPNRGTGQSVEVR